MSSWTSSTDGPILTKIDAREDSGEGRDISMGMLSADGMLVGVHTDRGEITQMISARKANRRERRCFMTISRQRLNKIEAMRDEDTDYSDIPETDKVFWAEAELRMPQSKKGVYLRLDQDLLAWLKAQGPGYQTRINAILRAYMETHQPPP